MSRKSLLLIVSGLILIVVAVGLVTLVFVNSSNKSEQPSAQVMSTVDSFPVPAGTRKAFPDVGAKQRIDRGWYDDESVEQACTKWSNAFRLWVGEQQPIGSVTGEHIPGSTCNYSGKKNGFTVTVNIAKYGQDPTQATLSVNE